MCQASTNVGDIAKSSAISDLVRPRVQLPHRLIVQVGVQVALLGEELGQSVGAPGGPVGDTARGSVIGESPFDGTVGMCL